VLQNTPNLTIKMPKIIHEHEPGMFNTALAEELEKIQEFKAPDWSFFVKSGSGKQRMPYDDDFWYKRAASILRQLYIKGVVGVGRLKTRYGSRKKRGVRPSKFKKSSGKIIRTILQQAEKAGFVERLEKIQHGRRLTKKGKEFLDSIKISKPEVFKEDNNSIKLNEKSKEIKQGKSGEKEKPAKDAGIVENRLEVVNGKKTQQKE